MDQSTPVEALQNDVIDGVFADKVVYGDFKEVFSETGEPINNYVRMLSDLYDAVPEGKMVIGNTIRTERTNSNRALMEVMDGSYMERWAVPGTASDEAEAISISIQSMREALAKGKMIHFQTSPHDTGGDAEPDDYAGKVQYAKDNVNFPLAVYLIVAEENAYFSYQVSVNAKDNAQEAWNTSFVDEFSYRLGAPLGPPTKDGYAYQRSFENVDVWVDVNTREAILDWKDKTKITNTECSTLVTPPITILTSDAPSLITVYPNPSTGVFNITNAKGSVINIRNNMNQLVLLSQVTSNKFQVDLSDQTRGVYFLKINNGNIIKTQKIIIQ